MRNGFTLVECMLASAIFCLITLALFEGVIMSTRIAHENSDLLVAEAVAWDAAWKRFNESVDDLTMDAGSWVTLPDEVAPQLSGYDAKPKMKVTVQGCDLVGWSANMRKISVNLEWGPSAKRHRLSEYRQVPTVYRGELGRSF